MGIATVFLEDQGSLSATILRRVGIGALCLMAVALLSACNAAPPTPTPPPTPTATPSPAPTAIHTATPTATLTAKPTLTHTTTLTATATVMPTVTPTATPAPTPTVTPRRLLQADSHGQIRLPLRRPPGSRRFAHVYPVVRKPTGLAARRGCRVDYQSLAHRRESWRNGCPATLGRRRNQ